MRLPIKRRRKANSYVGRLVAGVDEAGRGPLAGPVAIAAVVLDPHWRIHGLADSKVLCKARREELDILIRERAICFSIVFMTHHEVDGYNIFRATMIGMTRAVAALSMRPEIVLIDGKHTPSDLCCDSRAIIDGDALEPSISAASILAKVARDRYMLELDTRYPDYGFARHKGYSTPEHLAALQRFGPCPEHRRSFEPVRAALSPSLF